LARGKVDNILQIFPPALLFEAAFHLDFGHLWDNVRIIALLAIPGVLLFTSIVGAILHLGIGLAWLVALLFGSLISTEEVYRDLVTGLDRRLETIGEWVSSQAGETCLEDTSGESLPSPAGGRRFRYWNKRGFEP
jgi:hypothetical protein